MNVIERLLGEGGLLRVRAVLAISMTLGGVAYLLGYHEMPPAEYNTPWLVTLGWYFMARGNGGGSS